MANTPYIQFFLTDVEVSVLEADVASVTCTENVLTADDRAGPDGFGGARAVATNVFVRTAGRLAVVDPSRLPGTVGTRP